MDAIFLQFLWHHLCSSQHKVLAFVKIVRDFNRGLGIVSPTSSECEVICDRTLALLARLEIAIKYHMRLA